MSPYRAVREAQSVVSLLSKEPLEGRREMLAEEIIRQMTTTDHNSIIEDMKKGDKITSELMLLGKRPVKFEGKIRDQRKLFGRNEFLVKIEKMEPVWITQDKINQS